MGLETFGFIDDLNPDFPLGSDPVSEGDDHIRGVKLSLQGNVQGDASGAALRVGSVLLVDGDPLGASRLRFVGDERVASTSVGAEVIAAGAAATTLAIIAAGLDIDARATLRGDSGGLQLRWDESVLQGRLMQTNSAGSAIETWISMNLDASVAFHFDGGTRLVTTAEGMDVLGSVMELDNSGNDANTTMLIRNFIGGVLLRINSATGLFQISQTAADGAAQDLWTSMERDGAVSLNFNGIVKLATADFGGFSTGQHRVSEAAPLVASDLTRKDYVDGLIADLQTQIDNIINGTTAFTGVVNGVDFIANG